MKRRLLLRDALGRKVFVPLASRRLFRARSWKGPQLSTVRDFEYDDVFDVL